MSIDLDKVQLLLNKLSDMNSLSEELGLGPVISEEACRALLLKVFKEDDEDIRQLLRAAALPQLTNLVQ